MRRLCTPSVCSAISFIAWIGNVTAVPAARWFTVSAAIFSRTECSACVKSASNVRISPRGGKKKVQTYNWNGEAPIKLYQRLAATFDGERGRCLALMYDANGIICAHTCRASRDTKVDSCKRDLTIDISCSISSWSFFGSKKRLRFLFLSHCIWLGLLKIRCKGSKWVHPSTSTASSFCPLTSVFIHFIPCYPVFAASVQQ